MSSTQLGNALQHLCRLAARADEGPSDRQLVERYLERHDESAFAELVGRHGNMVLNVCRGVLRQEQDAEDAFQATFLVLARKADTIRRRESVGSWLYGVAYRLALRSRTAAARRRTHEGRVPPMPTPDAFFDMTLRELWQVLYEEIERLPEQYRLPVILCYLEGQSHAAAACRLGWTKATVRGRLNRGRAQLRERLSRRGLALSAAALATAVAANRATAAVGARLRKSAVEGGLRFATGGEARGLVSAGAVALAEGGLQSLFLGKARVIVVLMLALGLLAAGAGALARQLVPQAPPLSGPAAQVRPSGAAAAEAPRPRIDQYGDPLPPEAVARLGSLRLYHGRQVDRVILSPDGTLAVSVGRDTRRLWDAVTGRELALAERFKQAKFFAAGGKLLALVRQENSLAFWDLGTGREVRTVRLDAVQLSEPGLGLSPDGKTLTLNVLQFRAGKLVNALHLVDVATGKVAAPIDLDAGQQVPSVHFAADSRTLVVRDGVDAIHVWDVATRTRRQSSRASAAEFGGHMALSPDARTLATASYGGQTVRLWDVRTFKELATLTSRSGEAVNSLAFSPDGKLLATTEAGPMVRLWDLTTCREARQLQGKDYQVFEVVFSADGKTLAGGDGGSVTLWDVATGQFRHDFGHTYCVAGIAFSPDGKRLASGAAYTDKTGRVWDPLTGKELLSLRGHGSGIEVIAYAPDGKLIASGSQDGSVRLWDAATGAVVRALKAKDGMVYSMAFAPDGKTLATGGRRKAVHLWDVETGREVRSFANPGTFILKLAFSPDGKLLATRSIDERVVRLWDVERGQEIRKLAATAPGCPSLAFTPDGQALAAGGDDGVVRWWTVRTGEERQPFGEPAGPGHRVFSIAFAPDGRSLAAGYQDATVRLWETASRRERVRYLGHRAGTGSLAFSPDGTLLASGGTDRIVVVWDVTGRITAGRSVPIALDALWTELGSADVAAAFRAAQRLLAAGAAAPAFLKERLRPVASVDARRLERLLADLDSDRFAEREQASRELRELGDAAEPALRKALAGNPSAELRRRAERLLAALDTGPLPERLAGVRAVEVLEHLGTPEARRLLEVLATGGAEARLTREAKASLRRLHNGARQP